MENGENMLTDYLYDIWLYCLRDITTQTSQLCRFYNDQATSEILTFNNSMGVSCSCVDGEGNLFVATVGPDALHPHMLYKITNGVIVNTLSLTNSYGLPRGMCIDGNNVIWITMDGSTSNDYVFKIVDFTIQKRISVLNYPDRICCDKSNNIWIAHGDYTRVTKISNDVVSDFSISGSKIRLYDICCDKNNAVWVANSYSNSVHKIVNGFVNKTIDLISYGATPTGLCVDKNNNLYVTLWSGKKIIKITNDVVVKVIDTTIYSNYLPAKIWINNDNVLFCCLQDGPILKIKNDNVVKTIELTNMAFASNGDINGMARNILFGPKIPERIITQYYSYVI